MTRGEQAFRIYRDHHATPRYERRRRERRPGVRALAALAVVGRHVTELNEDLEHHQAQAIRTAGLNRRPRVIESNAARAERLRETRRDLARTYRHRMEARQFDATSITRAVDTDIAFVNLDDILTFTSRN